MDFIDRVGKITFRFSSSVLQQLGTISWTRRIHTKGVSYQIGSSHLGLAGPSAYIWNQWKSIFHVQNVSILFSVCRILTVTNTSSLVSITIPSLWEFLTAEFAFERLGAIMRADMVFDVRELCKRLWAHKASKAPVQAHSHWVQLVEDPPLLVHFFDNLRCFDRFMVFLIFTEFLVAYYILKAAFPAAIRCFQIPARRLQLCRKCIRLQHNCIFDRAGLAEVFALRSLGSLVLHQRQRWLSLLCNVLECEFMLYVTQVLKHFVIAPHQDNWRVLVNDCWRGGFLMSEGLDLPKCSRQALGRFRNLFTEPCECLFAFDSSLGAVKDSQRGRFEAVSKSISVGSGQIGWMVDWNKIWNSPGVKSYQRHSGRWSW